MKASKIIFDAKARNTRSVCSWCGNFFSDGDEVTVCPNDNTPHHTACWKENKGCSKGDFEDIPLKPLRNISPWKIFKTLAFICFGIFSTLALLCVIALFVLDPNKNLKPASEPTSYPTPLPFPSELSVTEPEAVTPEITSPSPQKTPVKKTSPVKTQERGPSPGKNTEKQPSPRKTVNPEALKPFEEETQEEQQNYSPENKTDADIQKKAVQIAIKQTGKPYVWETTGPDTFDCAGLCGYAYWMASGKEWNEWHIFYISDMLKLCNIYRDFSEIRPGDLVVKNNYQYLKPFDIRNEENQHYDTHAEGWPYGESPVHDYGHIGMYVGKVTCNGVNYNNAVVEAKGKDYGVIIGELDSDGDGNINWGKFFYRPKKVDNSADNSSGYDI
ncbi:MAG: RING finger protein [Candidatus Eremiobacterota bacterium]